MIIILQKVIHNAPIKTYEYQTDKWIYCGIKDTQTLLSDNNGLYN